MKRTGIFILLWLNLSGLFAQEHRLDSLFASANEAYRQGNYALAEKNYKKILSYGYHAADLYYNLGNTAYKQNNIPLAIYYYEKALRLNPDLKEARDNLALVKNSLQDKIKPLPVSPLSAFWHRIVRLMSPSSWGVTALFTLLLSLVFFDLYLFSRTGGYKRLFFILMLIAFMVSAFDFAAGYTAHREQLRKWGIVFVPEADLYAGPAMSSGKTGKVHEGLKVEITGSMDDWYQIKLPDGNTAWIPRKVLKPI